MSVFGFADSFHIVEPMISGTPLNAWVIAPIYAAGYALILLMVELIRKYKRKKAEAVNNSQNAENTDKTNSEK